MDDLHAWSANEFGEAQREIDLRNAVRLVDMGAQAAMAPGALVTRVMKTPASREGAFRFLESGRFNHLVVAKPMFGATARRCADAAQIVLPVDQSTVSVVDRKKIKGLGRTGTVAKNFIRRGMEVMSALAVGSDGQTMGLLAQEWLVRSETLTSDSHHSPPPVEERESILWSKCILSALATLKVNAPNTRPWLQMDRGADIGHLFTLLRSLDADYTVRSNQNRALNGPQKLRETVAQSPVLGRVTLTLPDSEAAPETPRVREAKFKVRARKVEIRLQDSHGRYVGQLPITVVHIRETSVKRKPVQWFLLTNRAVSSLEGALEVVANYRLRWRIEEFHRAWKTGVCDVESSQLRSADALRKWATILAAVAARVEHLKTMARGTPDVPATQALSRDEIDSAIALSETKKFAPGDTPTIQQAVELIAFVGGYTGRNSGGPPGATVIKRGLHDVLVGARAIAIHRRSG